MLHTLHFFNNMSGNGGAVAIADIVRASPALKDFRFSSSRGGNEGGVALASALRHAVPTLERLDLNDNTFGPRGGIALGTTLRWADALTYLNVGDIAMEDAGMAALASGLVRSGAARVLETLIVSANDITADGAKAIARCVRRCVRLRVIDASENPLEAEGAGAIARALTRRGAFRAAAAARTGGGAVAAGGGASSKNGGAPTSSGSAGGAADDDPLEEVLLNETGLGRKGAVAVARAAAAALPRFKRLGLAENELSARSVAAVHAALGQRFGEGVLGGLEDAAEEGDDDDDDGDDDGEWQEGWW